MVVFSASANEYSDEEMYNFIEVVDNCNATYGPGIATVICVYRKDGQMMMGLLTGLLTSMPADVSDDRGLSTEESDR